MESKKLPNLSGRKTAGRKGASRLVKDLNPEEKEVRETYEAMRKRRLRARMAGETDEQYGEHADKRKTQAESVLRGGRESKERSRMMDELRRDLDSDAAGRNPRRTPSAGSLRDVVGGESSRNFGRARAQIRKQAKTVQADDWDRMVDEGVGKGAIKNLEIREDYSKHGGDANMWTIDGGNYRDPELFLDACRPLVEREVSGVVSGPQKKVRIVLTVLLIKQSLEDGSEVRDIHAFRSDVVDLETRPDMDDGDWREMISGVLRKISNHKGEGSGWVLGRIESLFVYVDVYDSIDGYPGLPLPPYRRRTKDPPPSDGPSGSSWIPLPKCMEGRGAVVNLRNAGDDCFPLSVAAAEILRCDPDAKNLERVPKTLREHAKTLEMGDIRLPMRITDIPKFEDLNPMLRIQVFGVSEDGSRTVVLYTRRRTGSEEMNRPILPLFFWGDGKGNHHYSPIKKFHVFISRQKMVGHRTHTCHNCMQVFSSTEVLEKHLEDGRCYENDPQEVEMVDDEVRFSGIRKTQTVPVVIYSDSESFNRPLPDDGEKKNTTQLSKQTPSGLGYCAVGSAPGFRTFYKSFGTVAEYVISLAADARSIYKKWIRPDVEIRMTPEDVEEYLSAEKCYRCGWHLADGDNVEDRNSNYENKVRDHDHFTGKYRGAACKKCNAGMQKPKFIPVYFHNLEGYDGPLIVREVSKVFGVPYCLSRASMKYTTFTVEVPLYPGKEDSPKFEIRFMDSLKLMSSGLSNLVSALGKDDMHVTRAMFPNMTDVQSKLMKRKGIYPYDWVDDPEKLRRIGLPPISDFYNRLADTPCSKEDYMRAHMVWCEFGCVTMQDYHDLYLKSDVCQLADVVESFRKTCRSTYGLDPPWYPTAPSLSWDAMFKITGTVQRTVPDHDMHLFVEGAVRGGISVVVKRYSEANHKYMVDYDPSKPSVFIIPLDMNNLYGCAMTSSLPDGKMVWMTDVEMDLWRDIVGHNVGDDKGFGFFAEVDLEYPDSIHDDHSDYPMACERVCVGDPGLEKLVPNLHSKTRYIIHHDELRQCLKHGMILRKMHRGLIFKQSKWMKSYIDLNTGMRAKSTTKFEQDFYKLMNNSVYGKTMENVRKRTDTRLVDDKYKFRRFVSKIGYKGSASFTDDNDDCLLEVEMGKGKVKLDKLIPVGAAVLSISKVRMYEFFYEYVKPKWGDDARLLSSDTDSFILEIHTEDFYADIAPDLESRFDTSKMDPNHIAVRENLLFKAGLNGRVLGMMKDESEGSNVVGFVGLRPKSNISRMEGDDTEDLVKCKGVKKYVADRMTFQEHKDCLFTREPVYKTQNTLRNRNHEIYVERMTKKALCGEDDKRFVLENRIDTLPWGHYSLRS